VSRPDPAARGAMAHYRPAGRRARTHVAVRWRSAPFAAVAAYLPPAGRVLEVGCGHGLFLAYAAHLDPARQALGVDIDADKIELGAQALAGMGQRVRLQVGRSGAVPPGPWDAIVFLDVLYLLPADEQHLLLSRCAAELAPAGVLLVKEMAETPRWKARWNRAQETLAVRVLRITAGHDLHFVPTSQVCSWLTQAGLTPEVVPLDRGYPHPHQLVIARRDGPGAERR
jgi:2-polyprenyl-3-methyl-5-hydroxy-6-metoxy-1,4-benzoquinol methylase